MSWVRGHFSYELIILGCFHLQRMILVRDFKIIIEDFVVEQGLKAKLALWFWSWTDFQARNNLVACWICFFAQREVTVCTAVWAIYAYVLCLYHFFPSNLIQFLVHCCNGMGYLAWLELTAKLISLADSSDCYGLFSYEQVLSSEFSTLFSARQASPHCQLLCYDSWKAHLSNLHVAGIAVWLLLTIQKNAVHWFEGGGNVPLELSEANTERHCTCLFYLINFLL